LKKKEKTRVSEERERKARIERETRDRIERETRDRIEREREMKERIERERREGKHYCQKSHPLELNYNRNYRRFGCDVCHKLFTGPSWHCRNCSYDVCRVCRPS